ncbi:4'-phosphopantetheinyl transferase family protein [Pareuzebyella sediminis]|uniref:4'-phosphopantetheinyl transferase family protein n=1 Tax=Pareuzebyella sediminis TaxID=2607998 RepID=UPI0011ECED5A|nr:4'-phosphopantetheinyl transferase superfamily protein [Pareuzebyella sediminis]
MELQEGKAHVWYFSIDQFSGKFDTFKNVLSHDEIDKASTFKFEKDQNISVLSRGLLKMISAEYLGIKADMIDLKYGTFGKPFYANSTSNFLKFNVSHSGNYIVLAFTKDSEIGVDVELIKRNFNVLDIAQNFFSIEEIKSLKTFEKSERVEAFFRCWTRKEAFIKAKGSGLSFPLDAFTVSLDKDNAELLRTEWDLEERKEWRLFSFVPAKEYVGGLLVNKKIHSIEYFDFDFFKSRSMLTE